MDQRQRHKRASRFVAGHGTFIIALTVALLGVSAGCSDRPFPSRTCTLIGCSDQFTATVSAASDALPAGTHMITVTADAMVRSCLFELPLQTLPGGGTAVPACESGLLVMVGPATMCTTIETDAAVTQRCDPIPGQLVERISVSGTPTLVHVQQSVGGTVVLDRSATPMYQTRQPNGPGCDPICQQGGVEWTIP